jgi:hypothetical protein
LTPKGARIDYLLGWRALGNAFKNSLQRSYSVFFNYIEGNFRILQGVLGNLMIGT